MTEPQTSAASGPALLAARLGIGFAQGVALYLLERFGKGLPDPVLGALALTLMLAPIVALGAIGATRARTLAIWLATAVLALLALGAYDGFVFNFETPYRSEFWPRAPLLFFAATALFVAHHLILPADAERRWVAGYSSYFDEGWKDAVRLVLGCAFVGALWLLLFLGAALFDAIQLKFLGELIQKPWFAWPATTSFFAIAVHVTAARAGLVLGARTLALNLLAWLLPLMTVIAGGFLVALAFTGLGPLWGTGRAGGILLAASAALVVLLNATYQDGERDGYPPVLLKWAVRISAVLLAPLVAVAIYGLALRIGQHGLTPQRVHAIACLVVATAYAAGYLWAALARGPWMRRLERVNVLTAHLIIAVILAVFSPILDPARLSVADQMARFQRGKVAAEKLDYSFLAFEGGRWGREALSELQKDARPFVRERAGEAARKKHRWEDVTRTPQARRMSLTALDTPLPESFLAQSWPAEDEPSRACGDACPALVRDVDGAPGDEVIVLATLPRVYSQGPGGRWRLVGRLSSALCEGDLEALKAGRFTLQDAAGKAVVIDGRARSFVRDTTCPGGARPPAMSEHPW
ncbi:DUF4153 domain-containing protein [Phenylobacterium sp. J426]|uniref:DUF4153 domain-containing protein n=1 Tax=Phenylobacterium sp. J426 TaxID=2898439 RepID=UPI0021517F9D|nr:DUF4153 domain-containing protein [Phenylobacterium sp. J426]MCR5875508.1 DUF4153 domain-containing protein [Phenylobacterium sp. J426]